VELGAALCVEEEEAEERRWRLREEVRGSVGGE
jgi:hypothetical protein